MHIQKVDGIISILQTNGIGSSILLRGPPEGFGAISYNKSADFTLIAERVILTETNPTYFYGNITFHNFECTLAGKEIFFEPGKVYTFKESVLFGANTPDWPIYLQSMEAGQQWSILVETDEAIFQRVSIQDSVNLSNYSLVASPSYNRGNNINWIFNTVYWIGAGSDYYWSTPENWDPFGFPGPLDDVVFDGQEHSAILEQDPQKISIIDIESVVGSLFISSDYEGVITLTANLIVNGVVGNFVQEGGEFNETNPFSGLSLDQNQYRLILANGATFLQTGGIYRGSLGGTNPAIRISTLDELQGIDTGLLDATYVLVNDIDASATAFWNEDSLNPGTYFGFLPIGDDAGLYIVGGISIYPHSFTGEFQGQNYTISNLYINRPIQENVGLFGMTGTANNPAKLRDIHLDNCFVKGYGYVGGLAGRMRAKKSVVYNCSIQESRVEAESDFVGGLIGIVGSVSVIVDCSAEAEITATYSSGGLIGHLGSASTVKNCLSSGTITGTHNLGGLVGSLGNNIIIYNCQSSVDVNGTSTIGGLVGNLSNSSQIEYSSSSGVVYGSQSTVGGLVGSLGSGSLVDYSYATGEVVGGEHYVGGLIGCLKFGGTVDNCYAEGTVRGTNEVGGLIGKAGDGSSISNVHASGDVYTTDGLSVGGLFGLLGGGTIVNSYAFGDIFGGLGSEIGGLIGHLECGSSVDMINCYSAGLVYDGVADVGGLIGLLVIGTVSNSYYVDDTHGDQTGKGIYEPIGKSAFFDTSHPVYDAGGANDWGYGVTWKIFEEIYFPFLFWQVVVDPFNWFGTDNDNWSNPDNWIYDAIPSPNDVALFDVYGEGNDCNIDVDVNVKGILITSEYLGSFLHEDGISITIGEDGYIQNNGTFLGGNGNIYVNGNFELNNGTFTLGQGTLRIQGLYEIDHSVVVDLYSHEGTVHIASDIAQTLPTPTVGHMHYYSLRLSSNTNPNTVFMMSTIISGDWTIDSTATVNMTEDVSVTGDTTINGTLNTRGYDIDGAGSVSVGSTGVFDLTDTVEGDDTVINLGKDWLINSAATLVIDDSSIILDGSDDDVIQYLDNGGYSFYDLSINNTGGGSARIELLEDLVVDHELELVSGFFDTSSLSYSVGAPFLQIAIDCNFHSSTITTTNAFAQSSSTIIYGDDLTIKSVNDDITLDDVRVTTELTLEALNGEIIGASHLLLNPVITAPLVQLTAQSGIAGASFLLTSIDIFNATVLGTGNIEIANDKALRVENVSVADGYICISATSDLTVVNDLSATSIELSSSENIVLNASLFSTVGAILLTADNSAIDAKVGAIEIAGGEKLDSSAGTGDIVLKASLTSMIRDVDSGGSLIFGTSDLSATY